MYTSVRRYEGCPNAKELAQKVSEGFLPIVSQVPGFISYLVVDSGGGVVSSISTFLNQAAAEESNKRAADWVRQTIAHLLPNPPQITAGEVTVYKK
jgi:hypothetical protein